ncbi:MAG: phage head closure protein [Pseudomonadota bacterium]|mgnify:CR=1 FL=1
MTAPRLNRRLGLETPERVADGSGGYVESWVQLGVLWADVAPRTGRESVASGAPVSAVSYRITVRGAPVGHPERPMPGQRFRDGSRLFHVSAVTEKDHNARYLICFAEEEVVA